MTYSNSYSYEAKTSPATQPRFFARVMTWLVGSFVAMLLGIGAAATIPGVAAAALPLYFVALIALLVAAFSRTVSRALAGPLALAVPAILGAATYPTLETYVEVGMGNVITQAALGALIIFGGMAVWGWTTSVDTVGWGKPLFFITLGVIAVSLLNAFIFHSSSGGFLVSLGVLILFSFWAVHDIQSVKRADRYGTDVSPAVFALNIWLDIWNLFISLLNIFGYLRD